MSDHIERHEPTAEFRTFLEWQVASTVRRQARFAEPVGRRRRHPLNTIVLMVSCLLLGSVTAVGTAQVRDARERDVLLDVAKSEVDMAALRVQMARQAFAEARARFESGVAGRESLAAAEAELRAMEARLVRAQLDTAEIRATGAPARDEISAPAVNGRDFVTERLRLEMQTVQMQLAAMERTVAETERRVATGAAHQLASLEAEGDLLRLKSELELLARTAELRRDFLQEKVDAAAASTGLNRLRTMRELEILQREHALSAQRLSLLEAQQNAGEVGELEVLRTQLAQAEREMEIKNLRARLALLGRGR